jgi:hypothetical protein
MNLLSRGVDEREYLPWMSDLDKVAAKIKRESTKTHADKFSAIGLVNGTRELRRLPALTTLR